MRALLCSLVARCFRAVNFSARHEKTPCSKVVRSVQPSHDDSPDIKGSALARRVNPYLPDGRRFIAMLRRELSDEQIVALDIRNFIASVKGKDGRWTLLGEERRPVARVSDELWNAAVVWSSRRLGYEGSSLSMRLLLDPRTQEPLQVEDLARPPFTLSS